MRIRSAALVATTLVSLLVAPAAHAQATNAAAADNLFAEAKTLAEAGRYADACPKLEQSLSLDPAIGTEFNLADCYEHLNRNAIAYRHYRNVEKAAHVAGKSEREAAAHARIVALEPRLGWLDFKPAAGTGIATLTIDGVATPSAPDSAKGVAVDPGSHKVEALSTTQAQWSQTIEAKAGVSVPLVLFEASPLTAPPQKVTPPTERSDGRGNTQRTVALAIGAVGAAGLIVGSVTGVLSITNNSNAKDLCESKQCAGPQGQEGVDAWSRATTFGNVSTVGFIVGGVAAAAAVVLYVTAPRSRPVSTATRLDLQGFHF